MLFDLWYFGSLLVVTMRPEMESQGAHQLLITLQKDSSRFRPIPQEEYKSMENLTKFRDLVSVLFEVTLL